MATDFSSKSNDDINTWIANHEAKGATDASLYKELLEERARRKSQTLNVENSLAHLMEVARKGKFTTYGALAEANGIPWQKARYHMSGAGGHLDQVLDVCHARGLPLFPAICVNQQGVETGKLEESAMRGFIKGIKRMGLYAPDREAYLAKCQQECFEWGKKN